MTSPDTEISALTNALSVAVAFCMNRGFRDFAQLYREGTKLFGTDLGVPPNNTVNVEARVQLLVEERGDEWVEVVVTAYDASMTIGASLVVHDDGTVEKPDTIELHRFDGLPRSIARFPSA